MDPSCLAGSFESHKIGASLECSLEPATSSTSGDGYVCPCSGQLSAGGIERGRRVVTGPADLLSSFVGCLGCCF